MTEPQIGFIQVRCTDMEDYARIFNEGFDEARRQSEADVRTAGVRALKEAAAEQRRLAEDARTNNGHAEHEDIADWLEERADAIPGRTLHCPVGCDDGACETCPCCSAGFCVYGLDGLPDDPEDVGRWLEVASEHNPVAGLLKARVWPAAETYTEYGVFIWHGSTEILHKAFKQREVMDLWLRSTDETVVSGIRQRQVTIQRGEWSEAGR